MGPARVFSRMARLSAGLWLAALSACAVGPDYRPPRPDLPARWHEPLPAAPVGGFQDLARWWRGFNDPGLTVLVERALRENLDMQAADARLAAARARRSAVAAQRWPRVSASSAYQRERLSPNALKGLLGSTLGGNGGASGGLLSPLGPIGEPFSLFQAGFDSAWELDVFGGIRRQIEAADADAAAMEEGRRDLRVTLTAEVARNYLELATLRRRLEIARQQLDNQRQLRLFVAEAFREGLASALDLKRAQAEQEAAESAVPALEAQLADTRHGLALLLGQPPGALARELAEAPTEIPPPPALSAGLPSDLLRRRPDIRQAERTLAAATASVGVAVAELFPKLALTGSAGLQSQNLSDFASLSSGFYGFGPRLSLPIFQAGQLRANVDAQEARAQEALKAYEKAVLAALREAEDALANLDGERRRKQALAAAEASARGSAEAAWALYTEGEADLQTVLETRRAWHESQDQLALAELAWATGHIALFKALGGGWDMESDGPPQP
jgi:NodT family efflux transporter outer membrane factor (OMF) lipoprotein